MQAMDQAFQAAAALSASICVAARSDGSSDGINDGKSCGLSSLESPRWPVEDTQLEGSGSAIVSEVV